MIPPALKSWFAFGSGVGIQIEGPRGDESMQIAAVSVRPNGVRTTGTLAINEFAQQPAGVWGTEYAAFLKKLGMSHVAATVLLPRRDVIVRQIAMPGISDKDLAGAIQFQLEGLHPYSEDDVITSWVRLPETSAVLVTIARRETIDRYITLFSEAGVRVAAITCSAAVIYSGLRMFGKDPAPPILAFTSAGPLGVEIYGESQSRPLYSATFNLEPDRAAAIASSELRFESAPEIRPVSALLKSDLPLSYAAALYSACPHLGISPNLLPAGQRQSSSAWAWVPSAALAAAVVLLGVGLWLYPHFADRRYIQDLEAEIAKVQPAALRSSNLDKQIADARARVSLIDQFRRRSKADMDVLAELTKLLPPPAWLNSLDLNARQINLAGEAEQAAPLLKILDASPQFQSSEFAMPPMRIAPGPNNPSGEAFRIRVTREARP